MARKQSGGAWNRLLNFIGLVDDEDTRDTYGEEYKNGNYGRQGAYTPSRTSGKSTASQSRRSLPEPRPSREDSRTRSTRSSYSRDDAGYESYSRRPASRFDDSSDVGDYDARAERQSRFAPAPEPRRAPSNAPQRAPRMRVSQRSRTVMFSLHALEDCCDVIDQLIANNTVVLTMDELDGRVLQRAVDTLSGAVFALHASIRKASERTYLIAPMSVEVNDAADVERDYR